MTGVLDLTGGDTDTAMIISASKLDITEFIFWGRGNWD